MSLQKEVKLPKFENVFQQTVVNIIFTYHWGNQNLKNILQPYAITQQQHNVLRILFDQYPEPCTVNLLRSRILDQMSDTSRIVDRLIQKGFVLKTINAHDKRAVDVVISNKGLELLRKLDKEVDFFPAKNSKLTVEEAKQLNFLLDKYRG